MHMKRFFLLVFLIMGLLLSSVAQENEKRNSFSLLWGPGTLARQDMIFSPFVHSAHSLFNAGLAYTRQAGMFQQIQIRYSGYAPMLTEPYEFLVYDEVKTAQPHLFTFIDLDYLLGKTVKSMDRSRVTVGGLLTSDIQALNYVYGRLGYFGYYAALGLGGFIQLDHRIGEKNRVGTSLQFPLISWSARSPYLVNDDEFIENIASHSGVKTFLSFLQDGKPETWDHLQYFDLRVYYRYLINQRWQLGVAYLLEFIHFSNPRNLISFKNTLTISATLKF